MATNLILLALVITLGTFTTASQLAAEVQVVDSIEAFKSQNPSLQLVALDRQATGRAQFRYYAGNRQAGDRLVATGSNGYSYGTPQDVEVTITYPASGLGAVITYVEVLVNQSSDVGNAYIATGGIGQRAIKIIVQAQRTYYVNWSGTIYGK